MNSSMGGTVYDYQTLDVGNYNYTCNTTGSQNYTAAVESNTLIVSLKNMSNCSLSFGPGSGGIYPVSVNASCSCTNPQGAATLWRNGTNVSSENNNAVNLSAGSYYYVCNVSETQSYISAENSSVYTINKGVSIVNLTLDGADDNITKEVNSYVEINATLITPIVGRIQLYNDGSLINSGATPLSNNTLFGAVGLYNITAEYSGNENYSYDYETLFVTVIDSTPPVSPEQPSGGGGRTAFKSQCEGIDCGETVKACGGGIVATCQNLCAGGFCSDCTPECPVNLCEGIVCDQITRECSNGSVVSCNPKCSGGICGTCTLVCIDPCEGKVCQNSTEICPDKTVATCSNICENGTCTNCTPVCLEKEVDLPAGVKFALNLFYILLIASIPIIASYVGISLWKKGYWRELLRRRPNELDRYITSELQKGFKQGRVRNILIKYGWSKGIVDKAFRNIYRKDYEACLGKLQEYIKEHLKQGFAEEQIKGKILAIGWHKQIIEEAFKNLKK